MKVLLHLFAAGVLSSSLSLAQEPYAGGIVYGPKAAFKIVAPNGWVLDNKSGMEQGLPCVLYRKNESWSDAPTVMYAKIAGTEFEDVNAFVAKAIKEMEKIHGKPKEKIAVGKTSDDRDYFINEYPATKTYSQWERVAYIQLPQAVAYIVLSSRERASYEKDAPALLDVLKTFAYLKPGEVKLPGAAENEPKPIETEEMKLAMQAHQAEAAKNYDGALKLYAKAIAMNGRFTPFVYHNRGMLYLHRAKESADRQRRIVDLKRAIADFETSMHLGAASSEELNRGLEKVATRANVEEAKKLLQRETQQ